MKRKTINGLTASDIIQMHPEIECEHGFLDDDVLSWYVENKLIKPIPMTKQGNNYFKSVWWYVAIAFLLFILVAFGAGVSWWITIIGIPAFVAWFYFMRNTE